MMFVALHGIPHFSDLEIFTNGTIGTEKNNPLKFQLASVSFNQLKFPKS